MHHSFIHAGRDKNTYYHERFLRGKRSLSHKIQRIKVKGVGARKASSPETEPDFYSIPFMPETKVVHPQLVRDRLPPIMVQHEPHGVYVATTAAEVIPTSPMAQRIVWAQNSSHGDSYGINNMVIAGQRFLHHVNANEVYKAFPTTQQQMLLPHSMISACTTLRDAIAAQHQQRQSAEEAAAVAALGQSSLSALALCMVVAAQTGTFLSSPRPNNNMEQQQRLLSALLLCSMHHRP
jgi:hypothetical protein